MEGIMEKRPSQLLGIADEIHGIIASCLLYDKAATIREGSKPDDPAQLKKTNDKPA